ARHRLGARAIRAGQDHEQLVFGRASDAVKVAKLTAQRARDVSERALGEVASVDPRQLLEVGHGHQQARQRRALPPRAVGLLPQALLELESRDAVDLLGSLQIRIRVGGVAGSHAGGVADEGTKGARVSGIHPAGSTDYARYRHLSAAAGVPAARAIRRRALLQIG